MSTTVDKVIGCKAGESPIKKLLILIILLSPFAFADGTLASKLCSQLEETLTSVGGNKINLIGSSWFTSEAEFIEQTQQLARPYVPFALAEEFQFQERFLGMILQGQQDLYLVLIYIPTKKPYPSYQCFYEFVIFEGALSGL